MSLEAHNFLVETSGTVGPVGITGEYGENLLAVDVNNLYYPFTNPSGFLNTGAVASTFYNAVNSSGYLLRDDGDVIYFPLYPVSFATSLVQKTLFIDEKYGSDSLGIRERFDKPFKTLSGAQAIALSGDIIYVHPGFYSADSLGKTGVNWYFSENSTVNIPTGKWLFDNNVRSINNSYVVAGKGNFYGGGLIRMGNNYNGDQSNIYIEGNTYSGNVINDYVILHWVSGILEVRMTEDIYNDIYMANGNYTQKSKRVINSELSLAGIGSPCRFKIYADEFVNSQLYSDTQSLYSGRNDIYVNRAYNLSKTGSLAIGYLFIIDDGRTNIHNTIMESGPTQKLLQVHASEGTFDNCGIFTATGVTGFFIQLSQGLNINIYNSMTANRQPYTGAGGLINNQATGNAKFANNLFINTGLLV